MEKLILPVELRSELGKKNRVLRENGEVPAVVYGHSQEPIKVKINSRLLEKTYLKAGTSRIVNLKLADDAADKNVLFQEVQHNPVSGKLIHADFYLVKMDEKINTEVPLHFIGESVAVYQEGGTLLKNLESVEIEALPKDLPESIEVDISVLDDFDKSLHVKDLKVADGVTILDEPDELIAKVEPPRSEEELAELETDVGAQMIDDTDEEGTEESAEGETKSEDKSEGEQAQS